MPRDTGDPLPAEITLSAAEARVVYLAVVLALDELADGEAWSWCRDAGFSWRSTCPISPNSATNNMRSMSEELLTLPGAARELSMTADEALGLVEAGALAAVRGADGGVYIRRRDVQAFVAARSSA